MRAFVIAGATFMMNGVSGMIGTDAVMGFDGWGETPNNEKPQPEKQVEKATVDISADATLDWQVYQVKAREKLPGKSEEKSDKNLVELRPIKTGKTSECPSVWLEDYPVGKQKGKAVEEYFLAHPKEAYKFQKASFPRAGEIYARSCIGKFGWKQMWPRHAAATFPAAIEFEYVDGKLVGNTLDPTEYKEERVAVKKAQDEVKKAQDEVKKAQDKVQKEQDKVQKAQDAKPAPKNIDQTNLDEAKKTLAGAQTKVDEAQTKLDEAQKNLKEAMMKKLTVECDNFPDISRNDVQDAIEKEHRAYFVTNQKCREAIVATAKQFQLCRIHIDQKAGSYLDISKEGLITLHISLKKKDGTEDVLELTNDIPELDITSEDSEVKNMAEKLLELEKERKQAREVKQPEPEPEPAKQPEPLAIETPKAESTNEASCWNKIFCCC